METDKLLQTIHMGCDIGSNAISYVKDYVDNDTMLSLLDDQQDKYYKFLAKSKLELERMGINEFDEMCTAGKMMAKEMAMMKLTFKRTPEKVAKMLFDGATMGIEELSKAENKVKDSNEEIPEIALEYRKMLNNTMAQLERYL